MKAILEFDMYEDGDEFDDAVNGRKYRAVLCKFDEWLRGQCKYGDDEKRCETLQKARDVLGEITEQFGIKLWG